MDERSSATRANIAADLGARIQARRRSLHLSQEELGYELDTSRQTVSNWECEHTVPDAAMLARITTCLGTSANELLGSEAPHIRDRARATRRELVTAGCIVLATQLGSGFMSGMSIANLDVAGATQFGAFSLGILIVGLVWIGSIMRRAGLRTIRQMVGFARLASNKPGSLADRALRFACHWFWTTYFCSYTLAVTCGMLAGIASGDAEASILGTNLFMLGVIAVAWTWERHQDDA